MKSINLLKSIALFAAILCANDALAVIKMGVFPRQSMEETEKAFQPLADLLTLQLGEKVDLVVPQSFKAFWIAVKNNEFDVVHYNQYHYIRSHKENGYRVILANEEFGKKTIAGTILVRKDSGINSLKDLKGKMVLFGGSRNAMGSYIAPTSLLKKAGLVEGKDYMVDFAMNPPAALQGVYNRGASAVGAGDSLVALQTISGKINPDELKTIAISEPFTHLPWAVSTNVTDTVAQKIQSIMIGLKNSKEGEEILKSANVTGFYSVSDKDFEQVRELTNFTLGEKY